MNVFTQNLTAITMHKNEKICFRGRKIFSTENTEPLEKVVRKAGVAMS
jgi:hypothetical protein